MDKNKQKKRTALGNRLRTLRRCNGMTQREVAARLHLDRSSYAYYEIGKTEPDLHTLSEIAGIFRVSTDYLLGLEHSNCLDTDGLSEEEAEAVRTLLLALKRRAL